MAFGLRDLRGLAQDSREKHFGHLHNCDQAVGSQSRSATTLNGLPLRDFVNIARLMRNIRGPCAQSSVTVGEAMSQRTRPPVPADYANATSFSRPTRRPRSSMTAAWRRKGR
jgi:hypothetical protein